MTTFRPMRSAAWQRLPLRGGGTQLLGSRRYLLRFSDGRRVSTPDDWSARRAELLEALQDIQYGHLPPPLPIDSCRLQSTTLARQEAVILE